MEGTALTPARSDDAIREDVESELKWDPQITSPDITVAVKDGVVTLSGFVSSYWEKDAAEQAAKRVYGVRGVANDIEIELNTFRSDPEIARTLVRSLQNHVGIPAETIKTTVENGWVTLEGTVDWPYQKFLAEAVAKGLKGVVGVINKIENRAKY